MKIISFGDLKPEKGIPYSRPWIDELVKQGKFPKKIQLSANRVGFDEAEVDRWLQERAENTA